MASTSCASKTAFFIGTILIFFMLRVVNGDDGDYDGGEIMTERRQLRTKHYCVDVDLEARAVPCSLNVQSRNLAIFVLLSFLLQVFIVVPLSILHAGWHKSCCKTTARSANPLWDFKPENGEVLNLGSTTFRIMVVLLILRLITIYFATTVREGTINLRDYDFKYSMRCIIPNSETETWKVFTLTTAWAGEWILISNACLVLPAVCFIFHYLLFSCGCDRYDVTTLDNCYQPLSRANLDYAPESVNDILGAFDLARSFYFYAIPAALVSVVSSWRVVDIMSTVHDVFAVVSTPDSDWCDGYPDGAFGADSGVGGFDGVKWILQAIILVLGSLGFCVILCVTCVSCRRHSSFCKLYKKLMD